MQFDLSADQKAIRETVGSLLQARLSPQDVLGHFDKADLDQELWQSLCELGLCEILIPEEQSGLGLGLLTLAVIAEECGRYCAPAPVMNNALAAWLISRAGDTAQRDKWVRALASGKKIAAFAFAEASGWEPEAWSLNGEFLSGEKNYVDWGEKADLIVVGLANRRLALVEPGKDSAVCAEPIDSLDRTRPLAKVRFEGASPDLLPDAGLYIDALYDAWLVLLAADACGAAASAMEQSVEYAKTRTQFDRLIGSFQAVKHQLATMAIELEPARPFYWYAAYAWDSNRGDKRRVAALAKAHITDIAVRISRSAVEIHGGIGYTWEYPLHVWVKRIMYDSNHMGRPSHQRARSAAMAEW